MSVTIWTDEILTKLRHTGDELADDTVALIFKHHSVEEANRFFASMVKEEGVERNKIDFLAPEVLDQIEKYWEKSGKSPEWADQNRIKNAEKLFKNYGMIAFTLLGCASLPELYTCGKGGTQVLGMTLKLEDHIVRRIYETSQMIINVLSPGGLDHHRGNLGRGIRSVQKVRLMHAAVRHLILAEMEDVTNEEPSHIGDLFMHYKWNEEWGTPIGQEYMGATLQTFSYVIIRGMREFDIRLPKDLENDFIHAWNVAGHHMGVDPIFLRNVHNMDEAQELYDIVMARNRSETEEEARDGIALTEALVNFMADMIRNQATFGKLMPSRTIPRLLMEELIGHKNAELLNIRLNPFHHFLLVPFRVQMMIMGFLDKELSHFGRIADWKFKMMAKELDNMPRGPHRPPFQIPAELAGAWKLHSDEEI